MTQPYFAEFSYKDKKLVYVLAKHVSEKEYPDVLDHPTIITIRNLFQKFRPEVVIVEGIPTGDELSPESMKEHAKKCRARKFKGCGESFYAIDQAILSKTEFISGEPREKEIKQELAKYGYSEVDILGFYMVRQIPQMKRRNEFSAASFPYECERFLKRYRKRLGFAGTFGYQDFKEWYARHMTSPKSFLDIENNDPAPHGGKDATYIQKISHHVGLARDRMIVSRIENMMNRFDRVLIIYGGSHYLLQENALVDSLGKPKFYKEST